MNDDAPDAPTEPEDEADEAGAPDGPEGGDTEDAVAGASQEFTSLELFFDLVWAFAVSQLCSHLGENLTWTGVAQTVVMGLAMLTIWAFSMIESTMTQARRDGAGRIILATMGGGLVMNSSIPTAFATAAWGFVVPMVLIQVARSLAARHYDVYDELRAHRPAMAAWALLSAVPWVLGALAAPGPRLAWWVLALGIDLLGTRLGRPVP